MNFLFSKNCCGHFFTGQETFSSNLLLCVEKTDWCHQTHLSVFFLLYNIETNQQLSSNGTWPLDASFLTFRLNCLISQRNVWMNAVRTLFIFQLSFSVLINTICHFFVPTLEIFKLAQKTKLPNKNCQSVVFWEKCQFFFTSMTFE